MERDKDLSEIGIGKGDAGGGKRRPDGPLDGSTSGTIGGGGPDTGGSTARPDPPDMPPVDADNAASGRESPDPLESGMARDELKRGPTSVSRH
jgi:hypothetical protein